MRFLPRAILAGGAGFAVSFIAACGGGAGLLSGDQSNALSSRLDQISSARAAGDCATVRDASSGLVSDVDNLPSTINGTLRSNLTQGAQTVTQLAIRQCHPHSTSTTTPTATTTPTVTSAPTTQSTATTTPPTSTTTPSTPTATTPTSPGTTSTQPSGGGGLSGGGGPGQTTGGANGQ